MNDSTEEMMKEWRLRQPSAGLRSRIFAPETAKSRATLVVADRPFGFTMLMRWLVPAVGCFVMVTTALTHSELPVGRLTEPLSGQQLAFSTATRHTSMNNVPATTVEWTFGRASSSNNDSFVRMVTNTLIK